MNNIKRCLNDFLEIYDTDDDSRFMQFAEEFFTNKKQVLKVIMENDSK